MEIYRERRLREERDREKRRRRSRSRSRSRSPAKRRFTEGTSSKRKRSPSTSSDEDLRSYQKLIHPLSLYSTLLHRPDSFLLHSKICFCFRKKKRSSKRKYRSSDDDSEYERKKKDKKSKKHKKVSGFISCVFFFVARTFANNTYDIELFKDYLFFPSKHLFYFLEYSYKMFMFSLDVNVLANFNCYAL